MRLKKKREKSVSEYTAKVIGNIFSERDLDYAQAYCLEIKKSAEVLPTTKVEITDTPELRLFHEKVLTAAKKAFKSETLLPSWNSLVVYKGVQKPPIVYDSACTYAITVPLFQMEPWKLMVDDIPVELVENDGLFFKGNEKALERFDFPNPESNIVIEASFFFVEPDHWWFTEGESYLYRVIRAPKQ
jgi:hypothetical protein